MKKQLVSNSIDISHCKTPEDVNIVLNGLAETANISVAHALKAQIQIVNYISSPDLYGSAFDLFFKHLKDSIKYSDEQTASDMRDSATLMLNNFIFFIKAKIEWEVAVNREECLNLLRSASNDLARNIIVLIATSSGIANAASGNITAIASLNGSVKQLSSIFNPAKDQSDNWFHKGVRQVFKSKRTKEKQDKFCNILDRLAEKLDSHFDTIGTNHLIAGIYQNFRNELIEYRANAKGKRKLERKLTWIKIKMWTIPILILGIGGGFGLIIWFIRWIISWFSSYPEGWAITQWIWTGSIVVSLSAITAISLIIQKNRLTKKLNQLQSEAETYYASIIDKFMP